MEIYNSKDLRIDYHSGRVSKNPFLKTEKGKPFTYLISITGPALVYGKGKSTIQLLNGNNSSNLFCPDNNNPRWEAAERAEFFSIQFSSSYLLGLLKREKQISKQVQSLKECTLPYWESSPPPSILLKEQLFSLLEPSELIPTASELLLTGKINQVVAYFINELTKPRDGIHTTDKEKRLATMAKEYLEKLPPRNEFTLISLAESLGTNETTLKVAFKKFIGSTIYGFYHQLRMEKAERLLREGKTISEVTKLIGYKKIQHFSAVYKKETGRAASKIYR